MTDFDRAGYAEHLPDGRVETSNVSHGFLNRSLTEPCALPEPRWLLATTADTAAPEPFDLALLWDELAAGTWRVCDTFTTEQRHFAVVEQLSGTPQSRTQIRNLEILRCVLLGQLPKVLASDLNVGASTVAIACQERLRWMGLRCRVSRAPALLSMAASAAARRQYAFSVGRLSRIKANDDKYWLVSVPRPDLTFPVELSRAETIVVRQLLAGFSHAEISEQRKTSPRTIANQLASAFRKLGVSGRASILQLIIDYQSAGEPQHLSTSTAVLHG